MSISVIIIAQDEERTLGDVLRSVREIADEIVLVDSGSTDRTKDIAVELGARVVHQDWLGFAAQKNFALGQARCEWILSLDADEIIPAALAREIQDSVHGEAADRYDGFRIPRLFIIGEEAVRRGGFYPDAQLRLFRAGMGQFNDRLVHESVQLSSPRITDLKHHLLHKAYVDLGQFAAVLEKYARLAAHESLRKTVSPFKSSILNLALHPVWTFFHRYVVRLGFLDGTLGWRVNLIYADYVRKKIAYLRDGLASRP